MVDNDSLGSIEYRLPHLEEHALNEELLSRIQANDPSVDYLTYTKYDGSELWIARTGRAIGDSDVLRMLKVWCYCFGCNALQNLDDFCLGLQHNRSNRMPVFANRLYLSLRTGYNSSHRPILPAQPQTQIR